MVGAEPGENGSRHAAALAQQPEQQMLAAHVGTAVMPGFAAGEREDLLRPRRDPQRAVRRSILPAADDPLDVGPDLPLADPGGGEDPARDTALRGEQAEQDVLSADVTVAKGACLVLGQRHRLAGS